MEVIGEKPLWTGKFLQTKLISYRDRSGTVREWEAIGRVNSDGVAVIIPVTTADELILIRQFRPALNCYVIEFPAGLIDRGEDCISTAKRELIEETGYTSDDITLITKGVMATGIDTEKWRILLARGATRAPKEIIESHPPDENEDIEIIRIPLDNFYEAVGVYMEDGSEIDLRVYGLLELAKMKLNGVME